MRPTIRENYFKNVTVVLMAGVLLTASPVSADQLEDLKAQMQLMQEKMTEMHEQMTAAQEKIKLLESEKASKIEVTDMLGKESRIEEREAPYGPMRLRENSTLDFHGYTRLGVGMSEGGATQAYFKAPGAQSKYRLGNETDLGIEMAFDYRHYFEKVDEGLPYAQFWIRTDTFDDFGGSDNLKLDGVAEAYINFENFNEQGVSIWAGRRFYERMDIHMNDHFWLNAGQGALAGVGAEGMMVGSGEFKTAVFRIEDEFDGTTVNATRLDARLKDIEVSENSDISFWSDFTIREEDALLGIDKEYGFGLGAWHTQKKWLGGSNRLAFTYRNGASAVQGDFNARPVRESAGYDLDDTHVYEVNNDYLWEPSEDFAMQHASVFRREERGIEGLDGDVITWLSTGVRPVWFITDHISIPLELGYDYVIDEINDREGGVTKLTLALQYGPKKGYFVRPVFRLFATAAHWSDEFEGLVGADPDGAPYGDDTMGYTFGSQVEWWW